MAYTLNSTLGELIENPTVKGVLESHFPGITSNPLMFMFKGITIGQIINNPEAAQLGITPDKANAFLAEVNQFVK